MQIQPRAVETRTHLLHAALACFGRYGYHETSVARICQEAGVSKGAFYHHFASKQSLFTELLGNWLHALESQLRAIDAESASVPDALRRMAAILSQVFEQARGQLPLVLDFWSQARLDPEIWRQTVAPFRLYRDYFRDLVTRGIAQGALRPVDADVLAQTLVSVAVGHILQGLLDPDADDWARVAEESIRLLVTGLEYPSAGAQGIQREVNA